MYRYINKYIPYLFLLPALFIFAIFFFIPLIQTVIYSFFDYNSNIYLPDFCGFQNYIYLIKSSEFHKVILNTIIYMFVAVPILTIFPLFLAILLTQKIKFTKLYRFFIYLPVIISIVVVAIAFKWLYNENGILNYIFQSINLPSQQFLTNPSIALFSVIALTIFKGVGYYMMIYFSALMNAPNELYEAAKIDGANELTSHLIVTLPYIMPTIALVTTISSISALKVFVEIYVLTSGGPLNSTKTIVYYIYEHAFESLDLGVASVASVFLLLLTLGFSILNVTIFESGRYKI